MKKRIAGFMLCAMMLCISLLTGCSLVETNYKNYYTQIVAVVEDKDGNKIEITKQELMYAYQGSGYRYAQIGLSKEDAYKRTLTSVENTKIIVNVAEKEMGISMDGTGLSEKEKTYLYQEVVDAVNSNFEYFYNEIVKDSDESENATSNSITFKGYTKNATFDGTKIVRENLSNKLLSDFTYTRARDINNKEDKNLIYENFIESLVTKEHGKAFENYVRNLKANEYGLGLSTNQKDIFMRWIDRLYKSSYENYVYSKYNESILDEESTNVTLSKIANLYASKVRAGYTQYVIENDSAYDSTLSSSLDKMYYFKDGVDDNKYFTVANILIQFDDDLQAKYNAFTNKYEKGDKKKYSWEDYQSDINGLYNQLIPTVRKYNADTKAYEVVENANMTVEEVYSEIKTALANAQSTDKVNVVGDQINEFIYKYNQDPGMHNATNNYVIGVDKNGELVSNSFVDSFNEGAIELYDNGNAKIGDVSGYVKTNYGIHFLIYTGKCQNLFEGIDSNFNLSEDAVSVLASTRVNPLVDKTYFDVMYDEIYKDNTSSFQESNLSVLKQDFTVTEYPSRIKDLF